MEATILFILMVLIVILLSAVCLGLYLVLKRQACLERKSDTSSALAKNQSQTSSAQMMQMQTSLDKLQGAWLKSDGLMENLSSQMNEMNLVMNNAKKRGTWGEFQLETLIRTYLGESLELYQAQYPLENGRIADGAFHIPASEKVLCIDSKFPMENYVAMANEPEAQAYYEKELRRNIKKHISDVADKYITAQTLNTALLFVPSEAIYQYLCSDGIDLMNYAMDRHVMLVSPTTLCGVLYTLMASTRDFYRSENLKEIERSLLKLQEDCARLEKRSDQALKNASGLLDALKGLSVSARKIASEIEKVSDGGF